MKNAPKTFTSMRKADAFILESGWCINYFKKGSLYIVFATYEESRAYAKQLNK